MRKVVECSIIIKDDFDNIFIIKRKTKKSEPKYWHTVGRKVKGKESEEKCIARAIKDDLKSIVFNLVKLGDIEGKEINEITSVYTGELKEKIVLGKDVEEGKWIKIDDINNYEFEGQELKKLVLFKENLIK